ncbi:MAG: D-arabinono-1,4-lactone oxidase [Solirubrobacterales bacterium]
MPQQVRNWSGLQRFVPQHFEEPATTGQVVRAVNDARARSQRIRVRGNLHSFSEIVKTDDTLISLAAMSGVIDTDVPSGLVRVRAGTSIYNLSRALDAIGLAIPNLGDIDVQSIAGAAATGTHGTGLRYGNISAQVMAVRLVTAAGEIVEIDETDLNALKAARVSLGTLGVTTEMTMQCVPAFRLDRLDLPRPIGETLSQIDDLCEGFDHFEFYVLPYSDLSLQKRIDRSVAPAKPLHPAKKFFSDVVIENIAFGATVKAGKLVPKAIPPIARGLAKAFTSERRLDKSFDAFSTVRMVRFNELEYAIPREHLAEAVERVMAMIQEHNYPVNFPIEVRVGLADEASFLSTSAGRETGYISVHMAKGMDYEPYFHAVETIMDGYDGRPHWGKMNWQTADKLASRYPGWSDFQAVRASLDPEGVFSNDYTDRVLGPVVAVPSQG